MSPEEFSAKMMELKAKEDTGSDEASIHHSADELMCDVLKSLGYADGIAIYEDLHRGFE